MSGEHRRRYRLGYGVTVEFVFRPTEVTQSQLSMTALACEGAPAPPRIGGKGARERFLAGYCRAGDDFYQDVAQLLGSNLLNVEIDERGRPGEMIVFEARRPS